jgi:undecaprenyl pyrophosphate phosphatase UppP
MTDSPTETSSSYFEGNTIIINFIMIQPVVFTTLKYKLYRQTRHFNAKQLRITRFGFIRTINEGLFVCKIYEHKYAGNIQKYLLFF